MPSWFTKELWLSVALSNHKKGVDSGTFWKIFLCNFLKKMTVQRTKLRASKFKNSSHTGLAIIRDYSFRLKNQQCYRLKFTWSFPLKISIFLDSGQNFALEFPWPIGTAQRTGNCLSVSWILAINLRKNMGEIVFLLSTQHHLLVWFHGRNVQEI